MIMDRHQPRALATAFLHVFLYRLLGKKYFFCCIQRSAKSHACSKRLLVSIHSFHIPDICLLHSCGTMALPCSIICCTKVNWLATPQLVPSSTQSQREIKKSVGLFCIAGTTHSSAAELDQGFPSVEIPLVILFCAVGSASGKLLA